MALAPSLLTGGRVSSPGTTEDTASVAVTDGEPGFFFVNSDKGASGDGEQPTSVTHPVLGTLPHIFGRTFGSAGSLRRVDVYYWPGTASPGTHPFTITWPNGPTRATWSVVEATGADPTTPYRDATKNGGTGSGTRTTDTVALTGAYDNANNRTIAHIVNHVSADLSLSAEAQHTALVANGAGLPNFCTVWNSGTQDTSHTWTEASNAGVAGMLILEMVEAAASSPLALEADTLTLTDAPLVLTPGPHPLVIEPDTLVLTDAALTFVAGEHALALEPDTLTLTDAPLILAPGEHALALEPDTLILTDAPLSIKPLFDQLSFGPLHTKWTFSQPLVSGGFDMTLIGPLLAWDTGPMEIAWKFSSPKVES